MTAPADRLSAALADRYRIDAVSMTQMHVRFLGVAIAGAVFASAGGAQSVGAVRSLIPDSGAFFIRKELRLIDLRLTIPLTGDPDCVHERSGERGGTLSFRRIGPVTTWTLVDTIVRCDARGNAVPAGTRRDSGYVHTASNERTVVLSPGDHSPIRIGVAELRWVGNRRDSLELIGSDTSRRDLYVSAAPPTARPDEEL